MQLAREGFLEEHGVMLLGANPETIDKAEDRQMFKDTMESIGQPCIPSKVVNTIDDAADFAAEIGYPVIIRPAFTLGGTGGGIVNDEEELREITEQGLRLSPITQVLVEKCIAGWKEIEFEVVRDSHGNVITVCSMENFDPVGVHTGDSIVIAPAVTLSDKEYQMLRKASLDIISELKVEGGCNCQFALHRKASICGNRSKSPGFQIFLHWLLKRQAIRLRRSLRRSPSDLRWMRSRMPSPATLMPASSRPSTMW